MGRLTGYLIGTAIANAQRSKHWGRNREAINKWLYTSKDYQEAMEEWLYRLTAQDLGQPVAPIRWNYPRIERWDLDGAGKPTIPALIVFGVNPMIGEQQRYSFQHKLRYYITDLNFTWEPGKHWVVVERLPVTKRVQENERTTSVFRFATYDEGPQTEEKIRWRLIRQIFRGLFKDEWK